MESLEPVEFQLELEEGLPGRADGKAVMGGNREEKLPSLSSTLPCPVGTLSWPNPGEARGAGAWQWQAEKGKRS